MPLMASIMPAVSGLILALLSALAAWAGQRRQGRARSQLFSRRALDDQFKRPRDESELL